MVTFYFFVSFFFITRLFCGPQPSVQDSVRQNSWRGKAKLNTFGDYSDEDDLYEISLLLRSDFFNNTLTCVYFS